MQPSRDGEPFRQGNVVVRPARPWTAGVHALLAALPRHGFDAAPKTLGFDDASEKVSYLPGVTGDLDSSAGMRSELILQSAARLLQRYHHSSALAQLDLTAAYEWQLPARTPPEVICHGDFAPYNVVVNDEEVTGVIDFEAAHPGPRMWDLAYAVYRWAPLSASVTVAGLAGFVHQRRRARIFIDAYGLPVAERRLLPAAIVERLEALLVFMEREAVRGVVRYRQNLEDGHDRIYRADIGYVMERSDEIIAGLTE
ncbi:MAG: aminoglycoside phosphotransferase family protein [Rhizobium sp.]|nr:MAG: aminoglycoside phosphotransferase family protein [Rhizobium sp.]